MDELDIFKAILCLATAAYAVSNLYKIMTGRIVKGKLVDYSEVQWEDSIRFSPIYEYKDNGEVKRYTSRRILKKIEPIGKEINLLITKNGDVTDML